MNVPRLITPLILSFMTLACGSAVESSGDGGAGGIGGDDAACPEVSCPWGVEGIDDQGCDICAGQGHCGECGGSEICQECSSANGDFVQCQPPPQPGPDQFACRWSSCDVGSVCLDQRAFGDACDQVDCVAMPAACEAMPSCACLEAELGAETCSEDAEGNFALTTTVFH